MLIFRFQQNAGLFARRQASSYYSKDTEFAKNLRENMHHAAKSSNLWRNLSFFIAAPMVALCMANAWIAEQKEHHKPRDEFVPYDHLRIRHKKLPWGDGNHSLFHNPVKNALPTGYEVPDPNEGHGHGDEHHH